MFVARRFRGAHGGGPGPSGGSEMVSSDPCGGLLWGKRLTCVGFPQEEGALIIEGLLNIAWGLRRPIRLQIQDDRERVHLSSASWTPGQPSCPL